MLSGTLQAVIASVFMTAAMGVQAYDVHLAADYERLFEPVKGAKAGKMLHLMKPEAFVESMKKGKRYFVIDVRTPAESGIYSMTLPGSAAIPMNEVFKRSNLDRYPRDVPIVIVCKSGARAVAAGTALRHIGFEKTYILKGGLKALSMYLDPKTANSPPKPEKKK